MRKEIIIVILVGIGIGAVIAFGIYTARSALNSKVVTQTPEVTEDTRETTQPSLILEIIEPLDESVSDQEKIRISGKTIPNAVIAVISAENEYLLTSDDQGNFSVETNLIGGVNEILISAFDSQGNKAEVTRTVVYSTAEL